MNGLEIIERIMINQIPDWVFICVLLGAFSILIPTFIVYGLTKNGNKALTAELVSGLVYLVFTLILLTSGICEKPTGEYKYKVKITEDVGYIEFVNKYDVIAENDDGTYIIQEKSN